MLFDVFADDFDVEDYGYDEFDIHGIEDGQRALCAAIIMQAIKDYIYSLKNGYGYREPIDEPLRFHRIEGFWMTKQISRSEVIDWLLNSYVAKFYLKAIGGHITVREIADNLLKLKAEDLNKPKKIGAYKNDELIATFDTMTEAAKFGNTSKGKVSECVSGKRKTSGGYVWKYVS